MKVLVIFETHNYGKIEVEQGGQAYFHKDDYLADVTDGGFEDRWGCEFRVIWPAPPKYPDAVLQVRNYTRIAATRPI